MGDPSPFSTFPPVPSLQLEIGTSYKARPPGSGNLEAASLTSEDRSETKETLLQLSGVIHSSQK